MTLYQNEFANYLTKHETSTKNQLPKYNRNINININYIIIIEVLIACTQLSKLVMYLRETYYFRITKP